MRTSIRRAVRATVALGLLLLSQPALADFYRINLVDFSIEGHGPLEAAHSYLDVGVKRLALDGDEVECQLLAPRKNTRAAKEKWAPFDFYSNIATKEEQAEVKKEGSGGRPDIFYLGDDHNRNGGRDSHVWTRLLSKNFKGSIDFLEKTIERDTLSVVIEFTRGKIHYRNLLNAHTWAEGDRCEAAAYVCARPLVAEDGTSECEPGQWTRALRQIVAEADTKGYLSDALFGVTDEKEKNDIAAIHAVFQDLDNEGRPTGQRYRETVATK